MRAARPCRVRVATGGRVRLRTGFHVGTHVPPTHAVHSSHLTAVTFHAAPTRRGDSLAGDSYATGGARGSGDLLSGIPSSHIARSET